MEDDIQGDTAHAGLSLVDAPQKFVMQNENALARWIGLFLIALGLLLAYQCTPQPIR